MVPSCRGARAELGAGLWLNKGDVSKYTFRTDKDKRRGWLLQTVTSSCSCLLLSQIDRQKHTERAGLQSWLFALSSGTLICSIIGLTASPS